ncbi:hypothetical protein RQP46_005847 [Phenoliferia psychrophenolica]
MAEQSLAPGAPNIGPLLIAVWICTVLLTAECSLACRHQLLSPARRGILFLRMTVGALIVCNAVSLIAQFVLVYRMASPNPADVKAASHNRWELSLFITAAGISSGISNAFRVSRIWRLIWLAANLGTNVVVGVSMGMTFLIPHVQGLSLLIAINNTSAFAAREAPTLEHIQTNFPTSSQLLHRAKMMSLADSRRGSRYISDDGDGSPPRSFAEVSHMLFVHGPTCLEK